MPFTTEERTRMLALKGVGNTVINRLEQIGFSSLAQLQGMEAGAITLQRLLPIDVAASGPNPAPLQSGLAT